MQLNECVDMIMIMILLLELERASISITTPSPSPIYKNMHGESEREGASFSPLMDGIKGSLK